MATSNINRKLNEAKDKFSEIIMASQKISSIKNMTLNSSSNIVVSCLQSDTRLYISTVTGLIHIFDFEQNKLLPWNIEIDKEEDCDSIYITGMVLSLTSEADNKLYCCDNFGFARVFDCDTGTELYRRKYRTDADKYDCSIILNPNGILTICNLTDENKQEGEFYIASNISIESPNTDFIKVNAHLTPIKDLIYIFQTSQYWTCASDGIKIWNKDKLAEHIKSYPNIISLVVCDDNTTDVKVYCAEKNGQISVLDPISYSNLITVKSSTGVPIHKLSEVHHEILLLAYENKFKFSLTLLDKKSLSLRDFPFQTTLDDNDYIANVHYYNHHLYILTYKGKLFLYRVYSTIFPRKKRDNFSPTRSDNNVYQDASIHTNDRVENLSNDNNELNTDDLDLEVLDGPPIKVNNSPKYGSKSSHSEEDTSESDSIEKIQQFKNLISFHLDNKWKLRNDNNKTDSNNSNTSDNSNSNSDEKDSKRRGLFPYSNLLIESDSEEDDIMIEKMLNEKEKLPAVVVRQHDFTNTPKYGSLKKSKTPMSKRVSFDGTVSLPDIDKLRELLLPDFEDKAKIDLFLEKGYIFNHNEEEFISVPVLMEELKTQLITTQNVFFDSFSHSLKERESYQDTYLKLIFILLSFFLVVFVYFSLTKFSM